MSAANFDWNSIPGINTTAGQSNNGSIDHFDDFFNRQLNQSQGEGQNHATIESRSEFLQSQSKLPAPPSDIQSQSLNSSTSSLNPEIFNSNADGHLSRMFNGLKLNPIISHSDDTLGTVKSLTNNNNNNINSDDMASNLNFQQVQNNPQHSSSTDTLIADNEGSTPLSLNLNELESTELKTYLRWYQNILERNPSHKTVTIKDVFIFLQNFKIPDQIIERIKLTFSRWSTSLNIGQFLALMRLLAHALIGQPLTKKLVKVSAPIPQPISILSKKRKEAPESEPQSDVLQSNRPKKKLDLDSFTEFILTGERPNIGFTSAKNAHKKVKFSETVSYSSSPNLETETINTATEFNHQPQQIAEYNLSMNDLLNKLKADSTGNSQSQILQQNISGNSNSDSTTQLTETEKEELRGIEIDTFKNITQRAHQPIELEHVNDDLQPLKPNLTGSASKSMKEHFMQQFEKTFNFSNGSFESSYPDISSLSASGANSLKVPQSPNPSAGLQSFQNLFSPAHQQSPQRIVSPSANKSDYFNFQGINENSVNSQVPQHFPTNINMPLSSPGPPIQNHLQPQPQAQQPISRLRASSNTSSSTDRPAPPPPPPRSRKSSRATQPSLSSPPPTNGMPKLPPKPVLNEFQRNHFLSSNDNIQPPGAINGYNHMNPTNSMTGQINTSGLNGFQSYNNTGQYGYSINPSANFMPLPSNIGWSSSQQLSGAPPPPPPLGNQQQQHPQQQNIWSGWPT